MSGFSIFLLVLLAVIIFLILYTIGIYNGLVTLRNQVKNAWSQIDVQLKRRHDLIPNLVDTAKGYMQHERQTLEAVTAARSAAAGARTIGDIGKAEGALTGAISRFMAVAEQYPDLKANRNFLALQEELSSTENRIAFSRQAYNDIVLMLNNKVEMFPSNIIAGSFGFKQEAFFEIEDVAEKALPKIGF
jgi:LemA protein